MTVTQPSDVSGEAGSSGDDRYRPDHAFVGRVSRIADQPEFTPRNVATQEERINTFYAVEIKLPNPDHSLKPGMPADATF